MLLNKDIAQKLVNNIMENLGHNINIMNDDGIIIASGSPDRIGTYHQVAAKVIELNKRIDIFEDNTGEYIGVKEGINMPFYFQTRLAGVIGITGNPIEIESIAMLVKMTAEIMIEQEYYKEKIQSRQNHKSLFVNKLLTSFVSEDVTELSLWARKLGYDLTIKRVACLISIDTIYVPVTSKNTAKLDSIKKLITETLKVSPHHSKQDITTSIDINTIIILKTINDTDSKSVKEQLSEYFAPIHEALKEKLGRSLLFGIGSYHENILDLKESYGEAHTMIDFAEKMKVSEGFFYISDYILEYFFYKLPSSLHHHFLDQYRKELLERPEIAETIKALVKNSTNVADTAKELYVHRNTVLFRINKIKELFGIDPLHDDRDRLIMRLIDFYIRYYL